MAFKITGLDKLQRELADATKALESLDGHLTEVRFDASDAASVEVAIAQVEQTIDSKIANYRGNEIVESFADSMKQHYRQQLLNQAASARANAEESKMDDAESIYRRLNNAASDLSASDNQNYGQAIRKLSRLLHSPELQDTTNDLIKDLDLTAFIKAGEETQTSWIGSAKLDWPTDHKQELGMKILFIDRLANNESTPHDLSYRFYYSSNNINSNLNNMTRQLIVPFVRDYIDHLRVLSPSKAVENGRVGKSPMQAHPIHTLVGWSTIVMGLALVAFGVFALWRGSVSDTELSIFGNTFKSGSVGAVAIFLGVILLVLNYRRLLTSVERLMNPQ